MTEISIPNPEITKAPEAPHPSGKLMWHIAHGNFDSGAFKPDEPSIKKVSEKSYQALEAHHDAARGKDSDLRQQDAAIQQAISLLRQHGVPESQIVAKVHQFEMSLWSHKQAVRLEKFLEQAADKKAMREALNKIGFSITTDTPNNINLQNALYKMSVDGTSGEYGDFYKKFCKRDVNTNEALVTALSAEDMDTLKPFLVDVLGGEQAFKALKALRQTKDMVEETQADPAKQTQAFKATPSLNTTAGEQEILDFFKAGDDLAKKKREAAAQTQQRQQPTQPTRSPTPEPDPSGGTPRVRSGENNSRFSPEQRVNDAVVEVLEKAGKRTDAETIQLIDDVRGIMQEERTQGKGKLAATITETVKLHPNEYIHDGHIVYIPSGEGMVYGLTDLHGDFATLVEFLKNENIFQRLEGGENLHLVFMGDMIDRGSRQPELLEAVLALKNRYKDKITVMKADHELIPQDHISIGADFPKTLAYHYGFQSASPAERVRIIRQTIQTARQSAGRPPLTEQQLTAAQTYYLQRDALSPNDRMTKDFDNKTLIDASDRAAIRNAFISLGKGTSVRQDYETLFDMLPRMAVTANGGLITHGGPDIFARNLRQLADLPEAEARWAFDKIMTWGDYVSDTNYIKTLRDSQSKTITDLKSTLTNSSATEFTIGGKRYTRDQLQYIATSLSQLPEGVYVNAGRAEGGFLAAALDGSYYYTDQTVERARAAIGAEVSVRGHDHSMSGTTGDNEHLLSIHTSGVGSIDAPGQFNKVPRTYFAASLRGPLSPSPNYIKHLGFDPNYSNFNQTVLTGMIDSLHISVPMTTSPTPEALHSTIALPPEQQREVDKARRIVFESEASTDPEKHIQLIEEATKRLQEEKARGKNKLGKTIQETASSTAGREAKVRRETISDGSVVYIPSIPGERVITVGDIHGDLATIQQILKREGFFEDMIQNPPSLRLVFLGDLVDRGPKSIEVMTAIMQLKLLYGERVHIISADHDTVKDTVSPHDFPDRLKQRFGNGFGADAYGTYSSLFTEMAKMVVTEDGVAMVHGGPPGLKDATLQTVARFDEQDTDGLLRENMVWADPVANSQINTEHTRAELIRLYSSYIDYAESKHASDDMYITVPTQIGLRNLRIGDLRKAVPLLQQLPVGMLPNPGRSTGLNFDAIFGGTLQYNEQAFNSFLQNIGATVMVRGHQVSDETDGSKPNFYGDRLWTIHSTGTGSPESHYARRENSPRYAVFQSGEKLRAINSQRNIQDVWTNKPVQPRVIRRWKPSTPTYTATHITDPLDKSTIRAETTQNTV